MTTLAIPAFQASTQTALIRANDKPPLEVVVANWNPKGNFDQWLEEKMKESDDSS